MLLFVYTLDFHEMTCEVSCGCRIYTQSFSNQAKVKIARSPLASFNRLCPLELSESGLKLNQMALEQQYRNGGYAVRRSTYVHLPPI